MGIDISLRSSGEPKGQIPNHSTKCGLNRAGTVCTIREAYHGEPYVTRFLFREAFKTGEAQIPAATLRQRLPEALRLGDYRERTVYAEVSSQAMRRVLQEYTAFVESCERLEGSTGEPVTIVASY